MGKSPFRVSIPCPQCGTLKSVPYCDREAGAKRLCSVCAYAKRRMSGRSPGEKHTRLYHTWEGMRQRCGVTKCSDERKRGKYAHVTLCAEWTVSFEAFRDWSRANGYQEDLTIDRVDGSLGYSPDNCRWATYSEQNRNRRPYKWTERQ